MISVNIIQLWTTKVNDEFENSEHFDNFEIFGKDFRVLNISKISEKSKNVDYFENV